MPRIVFSVIGSGVQNVGYRLRLLQLMKEKDIIGFPVNLGDRRQVRIEAWGKKKQLIDFYKLAITDKPGGIGRIDATKPLIDNEPKPSVSKEIKEKIDLMVEQTGKFAESELRIEKTLTKMPKEIAKEMKAINT